MGGIKHIPKKQSGIYKIENSLDGKIYIGSSKNLYERVYSHLQKLRINKHSNKHMQRVWNKYGDVYLFTVLELCDLETMITREQYYMNHFESYNPLIGYNLSKTAFFITHSDETKARLSKLMTGVKHTEEAKRKISLGLIGRKASEKSIKKAQLLGKSNIGRKHSKEEIEKRANSNRGGKWTDEQRCNLSKILKGKKKSEEHCRKLSDANIGKKQTLAQKENVRIRMVGNSYAKGENLNNKHALGYIHTDEWKANQSVKCKDRWAKKTKDQRIAQAEKQRQTCLNKKLKKSV